MVLSLSNTEQKTNEELRLMRALRRRMGSPGSKEHDAGGLGLNSRLPQVLLLAACALVGCNEQPQDVPLGVFLHVFSLFSLFLIWRKTHF